MRHFWEQYGPVQGRAEPDQAASPRGHVRPGRPGGPHPNPAKASDGKRLHKLEPDPETAWVVRRIFAKYLAGRGLRDSLTEFSRAVSGAYYFAPSLQALSELAGPDTNES